MATNLNLSGKELNGLRQLGSLTFRPLARNRFRCNQKDVGRLTRSQVDTLRSKAWNEVPISSLPVREKPKRTREKPTLEEIAEIRARKEAKRVLRAMPQARLTEHGAVCPYCNTLNHLQKPGVYQCFWCSKQFRTA